MAAANHTRMREDPVFRAEVEKKLYAGPDAKTMAKMKAAAAEIKEKEIEEQNG